MVTIVPTELIQDEDGSYSVRRVLQSNKEVALRPDMTLAEYEKAKAAGLKFIDPSQLDEHGRLKQSLTDYVKEKDVIDPLANAKALADDAPKPTDSLPHLPGLREWNGREMVTLVPVERKHSMEEIAAMSMPDYMAAVAAGEI